MIKAATMRLSTCMLRSESALMAATKLPTRSPCIDVYTAASALRTYTKALGARQSLHYWDALTRLVPKATATRCIFLELLANLCSEEHK